MSDVVIRCCRCLHTADEAHFREGLPNGEWRCPACGQHGTKPPREISGTAADLEISAEERAFLRAVMRLGDAGHSVSAETLAHHLGMSLERVQEIGNRMLALGLVKPVMPTIH